MAGATPEFINQLTALGSETSFDPGERIFVQGAYADKFYLLLEGEIEIEAHSADAVCSLAIQTIQPGEIVGWSWLFPPYTWHFSATAKTSCSALAFNAPAIMVHAEKDPTFGFHLMRLLMPNVIKRLSITTAKLLECQPVHCVAEKKITRSDHKEQAASIGSF